MNNRKSQEHFAILIYVLQFITFLAAIHLILNPTVPINVPSIFVGVIGVLLTWVQIKRYQELSQSYGVAAQELSLIYEDGKHIKTDEELSTFVLDSENAISREHTLWIARKGEI